MAAEFTEASPPTAIHELLQNILRAMSCGETVRLARFLAELAMHGARSGASLASRLLPITLWHATMKRNNSARAGTSARLPAPPRPPGAGPPTCSRWLTLPEEGRAATIQARACRRGAAA
jgi:hypothetical protein